VFHCPGNIHNACLHALIFIIPCTLLFSDKKSRTEHRQVLGGETRARGLRREGAAASARTRPVGSRARGTTAGGRGGPAGAGARARKADASGRPAVPR
jgi:hypothetical protein